MPVDNEQAINCPRRAASDMLPALVRAALCLLGMGVIMFAPRTA